jgi:hypothetical protein
MAGTTLESLFTATAYFAQMQAEHKSETQIQFLNLQPCCLTVNGGYRTPGMSAGYPSSGDVQ